MAKQKILIVDDEKNIRMTVERALEKLDVPIETAVNGEEALAILAKGGFDLVLLDLKMPGKDGMQVLTEMREQKDMTKVVVITAHGSVENAVEAMKLGAVDFIQKPFSSGDIRAVVSSALTRKKGFFQKIAKKEEERVKPPKTEGKEGYDYCIQQAKAAIEVMDFQSARVWAEKAVSSETARAEAYNILGVLIEIHKDILQAQKYYRAAIALEPDYKPAYNNLERSTGRSTSGKLDIGGRDNGKHSDKKGKSASFLGKVFGPSSKKDR